MFDFYSTRLFTADATGNNAAEDQSIPLRKNSKPLSYPSVLVSYENYQMQSRKTFLSAEIENTLTFKIDNTI